MYIRTSRFEMWKWRLTEWAGAYLIRPEKLTGKFSLNYSSVLNQVVRHIVRGALSERLVTSSPQIRPNNDAAFRFGAWDACRYDGEDV